MYGNIFMHSATWPEGVRRLAKQYMKDPVQVQVGSLDLTVSQFSVMILVVMQVNESILTDSILNICFCNQWQPSLCLEEYVCKVCCICRLYTV